MAEVYLARRRAGGVEKWLVVKRMRPERSGDVRFLDLFVREARLSMSLVHQNIVPVFDFGRIDDQVFLAMERVEGKDLGSSLARAETHRLPPLLAAFIAAECCQALDYAHQRKSPDGVALGVVHRDVTPRNVLLSWSGEVKLTDFGIAALAGDATSRLLGTPQYMAPEQARSEPIDPRADIYAIGLVLREAVSGTRPRPGADRDTILDAARRGELLPWSHLPAAVPDPAGIEIALGSGNLRPPPDHAPGDPPPATLVAIIDRATALRPDDRYPDARSMLEELDSFIVGERAAHKAESPARQLAAWLSSVWEGARDDIETDATIEGDHLVSFLDDGALDVVGTGTVRSLAATAADDAPVAPAAPSAVAGPAPAATPALPIVATAAVVPAARHADPAARSTKISSSNATVASGSFHTIPTSGARAVPDRPGATAARRRKPPQVPPLASMLFVGLAVGAVVFFLTNSYRERDRPGSGRASAVDPNTALPMTRQPATAQPATGQLTTGQPATRQPATEQPATGQPATEQPATGQPATGQPATGQPATGQPATGQPATGQPATGQPHAGQPHAGQPHVGQPRTAQPNIGLPGTGQTTPSAGHNGSGSATTPREGSDRARCRVRINLTPWAYYSAEDGAPHETPSTIELTPGPHRIHVWNPELQVERDITINVPADRDTMNYSEPLQPPALSPDASPPHQP
jgi:serine/threonine protein kinase